MYLLVDCCCATFSNAARKAYTQIKKATLLGGMGTKIKGVDSYIVKNTKILKQIEAKKPDVSKKIVKRLTNKVNRLRGFEGEQLRSYTDAAQIARRGKTTPIKANTYIDRASYIQNPQDNTLLAGVINKIDKNTRATGFEYGTRLYKQNGKLKTKKIAKGTSNSVRLPDRTDDDVINIHSHPSYFRQKATQRDKAISVIPSQPDMLYTNPKETALIVSPHSNKKRTITKYTNAIIEPEASTNVKQYRQRIRKLDPNANYTVITPNKNQ